MKKVLFFFVLMGCQSVLMSGQTVALEEAYINECIRSQKWSQTESAERVRLWKQLRLDYPVLPYDTLMDRVVVEHVITFPGVMKDQAFKRVKEWSALHFGSLAAVTDYEDAGSGKIILEGWSSVWYSATFDNLWGKSKTQPAERQVLYSLVVTVKDGKAKVRYENIKYKYRIVGYMNSANQYVAAQDFTIALSGLFPVASVEDSATWKGSLDLLRKTMEVLNATAPSLEKYVRDSVGDNDF
jgi:hypothetical protein